MTAIIQTPIKKTLVLSNMRSSYWFVQYCYYFNWIRFLPHPCFWDWINE